MGQFFTWLFVAGLIALGLGGLAQAIRTLRRVRAAQRWATAEGKVIASTVDTKWNRQGEDYWIKYTYSVAGRQYTSKTIGFSGTTRPRSQQERMELERYYVGAPVSVYYDPRQPQDAVLKRDAPWGQIATLLVGALLALAWAALVILPTPR